MPMSFSSVLPQDGRQPPLARPQTASQPPKCIATADRLPLSAIDGHNHLLVKKKNFPSLVSMTSYD